MRLGKYSKPESNDRDEQGDWIKVASASMRQSQILRVVFFCLLKVLKPCLYGLGYLTQPHGEQLHATWPLRMRIVPPFGVRNSMKSFTKRSTEISLTWSWRFPIHSKYEKNSLFTLVKLQGERHCCTEVMSHFRGG